MRRNHCWAGLVLSLALMTAGCPPGGGDDSADQVDLEGSSDAAVILDLARPPDLAMAPRGDLATAPDLAPPPGGYSHLLFETGQLYPFRVEGSVAVGDFNHDGHSDRVGVQADDKLQNNFLLVALANPAGGVFAPVAYPLARLLCFYVSVDDIDGDGNLDVAVGCTGDFNDLKAGGAFILFYGDREGKLAPGSVIAAPPLTGMALADVNQDHKLDLIAPANYSQAAVVMLGMGNRTFAPASTFSYGIVAGGMAVADFDGDHCLDLASVRRNVAPAVASILYGRCDGTFEAYVQVTTSPSTMITVNPLAADLDGDGKAELFAGDSNGIGVVMGGPRRMSKLARLDDGIPRGSVAFRDLDGDGKLDMVSTGGTVCVVEVRHGLGGMAFGPVSACYAADAGVALGDEDADGRLDLMGFNETWFGRGDGTFHGAPLYAIAAPGGWAQGAADFNGDGKLDVVVASANQAQVAVALGNGDGTLRASQPPSTIASNHVWSIGIADLDGNGKPDVLVPDGWGQKGIDILLGRGDGTFAAPTNLPGGGSSIAVGDWNGDGKIDLATVSPMAHHNFVVSLGKGDGSFQAPQQLDLPGHPWSIVTGDFNGDSRADLAVTAFNDVGAIEVLLGKGDGTFGAPVNSAIRQVGGTLTRPYGLVAADFNGDGKLDLAYGEVSAPGPDEGFYLVLGKGDGTFGAPMPLAPGNPGSGYVFAAADFDLDHKLDLLAALKPAVGTPIGGPLIFRGLGNGQFAPPLQMLDIDSLGLAAADLNSDGKTDVFGLTYWASSDFLRDSVTCDAVALNISH